MCWGQLNEPCQGFQVPFLINVQEASSVSDESVISRRRPVLAALLTLLLLTKTFPLSTLHSVVVVTIQ